MSLDRRFEALDSWRGIAAIMVVVFHFSPAFNWSFRGATFIVHMDLAVDFFFLLSGFVISGAYERRLRERQDVSGFFVRRIGRLYPLHLFTLALMVAFAVCRGISNGQIIGPRGMHDGGLYDFGAIPSNLFLLQGVGIENHFTWNFPSWSISTEFYTYAVFAGLWVLFGARSLALTLLIAVGLPILFAFWQAPILGGQEFLVCIYCFAVGSLLRKVFEAARKRWPTWERRTAATLAELGAMALAAAYMLNPVYSTQLAPLAFAPVIFIFAFDGGWVSWLLRRSFPQMLGRVSYSTYLMHIPVLMIGSALVISGQRLGLFTAQYPIANERPLYGSEMWIGDIAMAASVAIVVLVAQQTYRWIEMPGQAVVNRLGRAWIERRKVRGEPARGTPNQAPATDQLRRTTTGPAIK